MKPIIATSNLISKEELKKILGIKQDRTLLTPNFQIIVVGEESYFDKGEVAERLGTDWTEPFLHMKEASEFLGIDETQLLICVVKKIIPYYSLSKNRGGKRLFKKYDLQSFKDNPTPIILKYHGQNNRTKLTEWLREIFLQCLKEEELTNFLTYKEREIIREVIDGKTLKEIGGQFNLTRERVRQIFHKGYNRINRIIYNFQYIINKNKSYEEENLTLTMRIKVLEDILALVSKKDENTEPILPVNIDEISIMRNLLNRRLVDFGLSVRALNACKEGDIEKLSDLVSYNKMDLLKFRNLGKKTLTEIEEFVNSKGLHFGMDLSKYYL